MKRGTVLILLLLIAVAVVFYLALAPAAPHTEATATESPVDVEFMGKTVQVPDGWSVYPFGTRGGTLSLTRAVSFGLAPTLTLEDERKHPEDPARFVAGWQASLRVPGFHPKSLSEYHDKETDAAAARCVDMRWDGNQRPYRVICLSANGHWKLTLSGDDGDVSGLDGLARATALVYAGPMKTARALVIAATLLPLTACGPRMSDPTTLHFLIESSPNNLDLRQGTDAQSERVGGVIYDALVRKDEHFDLQPWLATSWERPDALTWVFHLRSGVRFHDGKPMTAADVAWSIQSMTNGAIVSSKGGAFSDVKAIETPDALTLVVHTAKPLASLLFNLSDGLFGVVEKGAGRDEGLHPIGTGPFKFIDQVQDREVIVERNPDYWGGAPKIPRIRFEVIPDTITAALEMKKGSSDIESNVITYDMVHALEGVPNLRTETAAGAITIYANFNVNDPALRDLRVRQAIACAIDKPAIIGALWRGQARPANTLLPTGHWAAASDAELPQYPHDIPRAIALLEAAGLKPDKDGIRLRFTLKTSTDETTRLMAQAMQEQMRAAGIALTIRSAEFGTFYSDITKGAFQMYVLRWIGSNEDPDIFRYAYGSGAFPPKGGNRGHYSNPQMDALVAAAAAETDQAARRKLYVDIQQILATDLPGIPLWYPNNDVVHTTRLTHVVIDPGGTFGFLQTAELH